MSLPIQTPFYLVYVPASTLVHSEKRAFFNPKKEFLIFFSISPLFRKTWPEKHLPVLRPLPLPRRGREWKKKDMCYLQHFYTNKSPDSGLTLKKTKVSQSATWIKKRYFLLLLLLWIFRFVKKFKKPFCVSHSGKRRERKSCGNSKTF